MISNNIPNLKPFRTISTLFFWVLFEVIQQVCFEIYVDLFGKVHLFFDCLENINYHHQYACNISCQIEKSMHGIHSVLTHLNIT